MLKLHKFVVQAHLIEEDDDGVVVGEQATEPRTVFRVDGLRAFADLFEHERAQVNAPADEPAASAEADTAD